MTGVLSKLGVIARGDVTLTLRDKSSIFWIFLAPFLWVFLFGFISQRPADVRISLSVLNEDFSERAENFIANLEAENFTVTIYDLASDVPEGDDAPLRLLTIPSGFGEKVAAHEQVTLPLSVQENASQQATFAAQVALHKTLVRTLAGEAFGPMDPVDDAVKVIVDWGAGKVIPSGYYQTVPGNLVMFVLMSTMAHGAALLATERQSGMIKRLASSSLTRGQIIAGKLLGRVGIAGVQVMVFMVIGLVVFKIDWGNSPAAIVLLIVPYILTAATLGLLAGAWLSTPEAASGVGVVMTLVMSALGGCWWPAEIMPDWMRSVAYVFPTAWAMNGLHQVISWGGGVSDIALHSMVLSLFALGIGVVAARLLKISA